VQFSQDYFNGQATAASLLGMSPANHSTAAGHALPPSTAGASDHPTVWWSPQSSTFWVALVGGLTLFGMAGADARVRLGKKGRASASIGTA
jgi:hypothetical protein